MGEKKDDSYDPHDYRVVPKATTSIQAFINFLKACIGTGVLAMPNAFANSGFITGILLTVVIGVICLHGLHILISSMYELARRRRVSYLPYSEAMKDGMEQGPRAFRCLGPVAIPIVDSFLVFYHYGICSVYVVFTAASLKQIVDEYWRVLDVRIHMCIMLVPIMLIFTFRSLKVLSVFSAIANVVLVFGFGVVLYYIFHAMPKFTDRNLFVEISRVPTFFGTVLFALESVGVVLAIEENMKTPKDYVKPFGVMNIGMAIVILLYAALGFFGYWKYGEGALGSVTLNIPQKAILAQIVKLLFAATVLVSYALNGYVIVHIIWHKYLLKRVEDTSKHVLYELLIRVLIVLLTLLAGILIPNLGTFLSLVGAFSLSFLGLIFPAMLQISVHYTTGYGPCKIRLMKNIFIIAFGILGGVIGTTMSIREIIQSYS